MKGRNENSSFSAMKCHKLEIFTVAYMQQNNQKLLKNFILIFKSLFLNTFVKVFN